MSLAEPDVTLSLGRGSTKAIAARRAAEFERAYRAYAPDVARIVRRYVRDDGRVQDLVQETFLRAYRKWDVIDVDRPVWPLVRTIAHRLCIDAWRAKSPATVQSIESTTSGAEFLASPDDDPSEAFMASMRRDGIAETLESLDPRSRRILLLRDMHGLSYEEIARMEGTTLPAVRCALARARRAFREKYLAVA